MAKLTFLFEHIMRVEQAKGEQERMKALNDLLVLEFHLFNNPVIEVDREFKAFKPIELETPSVN